ncbi:helix-turn-helix domain-containing protein [Paenibacillus sp. EC2-1]|uniref:AraC family transcriptional regulator n=1 Tax=Paenibacillus sp. EC2-1 TaxID=3388665 RepID=UPI003BEED4CB
MNTIISNQYMMMLSDIYPFNMFVPERMGKTLFPPHWHDECIEIILFVEGNAELHIGGESYLATTGDLFLIGEGLIHSGYIVDEMPRYYTILLDRHRLVGSDLNSVEYGALLTGKLNLPTLVQSNHPHYDKLLQIVNTVIYEFLHRDLGFEAAVKSNLQILLILFSRLFRSSTDDNALKQEAYRRKVERLKDVISFVEHNYQDKITVSQAAEIASISPYHFCRVFKDAVGRTFNEYVQLYRIGRAEKLIKETDLPITRVAELAGFGTIHYLDELFKRHRGCTPLQFRKRSLSNRKPDGAI